jgi:protein-L-isoaspartate O-methyltransferase
MPYKIVAERDGKTVRTDRISLLVAAARARVWSSEGWNVVVTDGDGTQLDPAKFDQLLAA